MEQSAFAPNDPHGTDVNVSSSLPGSANGTWTITLHDPVPLRALEAALPRPQTSTDEPTKPLDGLQLALLTGALVAACAPASVMLWRSMRQSRLAPSDELSRAAACGDEVFKRALLVAGLRVRSQVHPMVKPARLHTRFERARIIGARALQIGMGAPLCQGRRPP